MSLWKLLVRPDISMPSFAWSSRLATTGAFVTNGSTVYAAVSLPAPFAHGMFVGQHGSWNREPRSGYRVIFVPFQGAMPAGQPVEVLTGFLDPYGNAYGRPVGVTLDRRGALLVADDVGNTIWRAAVQGKETRENVANR